MCDMKTIKNYTKIIRPFDIILILTFLLASFVPVVIFAWQQINMPSSEEASLVAIVTINGVEVDRFILNEQARYLVLYTEADGLVGNQFNIVEVEGERIRVQQDNSPDQIGVNMGWANRPGQTIIVLPHRFLIRLEMQYLEEYEEDIIIPF